MKKINGVKNNMEPFWLSVYGQKTDVFQNILFCALKKKFIQVWTLEWHQWWLSFKDNKMGIKSQIYIEMEQ